MKALIVDDEPIARQVLRELLEDHPDVEIAGEAADGLIAAELIQALSPDVVFLDLQMPGLGGLAVARNLQPGRLPLVVFVTAFEKHALDAFETGASDYLLKPVRAERLSLALEKVRCQLAGLGRRAASTPATARKIVGRTGSDLHMFDPNDVIAFEADRDVVYILTASGRYFSDHSLRSLEKRLDPSLFRRIHRRTIINTSHIRKISPLSSKRWLLRMSSGLEVVVSKRMAGVIREQTRW